MLTLNHNFEGGYGDIFSLIKDITGTVGSVASSYLQVKAIEQARKTAEATAKAISEQRAAIAEAQQVTAQAQQAVALQEAKITSETNINKYLPYILIGGAGIVLILLLKLRKAPAYLMPPTYFPPYMPAAGSRK